MFDNVKPAEDMFDGMETPPPPASASDSPTTTPAQPIAYATEESRRGFPWKPVVVVLAGIVIVGIAATLSYFLLATRGPAFSDGVGVEEPTDEAVPDADPEPVVPSVPAVAAPSVPDSQPPQPPADRDRDGLTDAQESRLGTSPTSADTDADGLFDKEENDTYETDPLNPDTDGDGYQDGAEVKNGYNPNGQGKLFEVP